MTNRKISFTPPILYHGTQVTCIKTLRELFGISLKDAKDITDFRKDYMMEAVGFLNEQAIQEKCQLLRNNGFTVGHPVNEILKELRVLASQALTLGDDELANEIIQLVLAEKIRRKDIE